MGTSFLSIHHHVNLVYLLHPFQLPVNPSPSCSCATIYQPESSASSSANICASPPSRAFPSRQPESEVCALIDIIPPTVLKSFWHPCFKMVIPLLPGPLDLFLGPFESEIEATLRERLGQLSSELVDTQDVIGSI